jgi:hypothetical protein
MRLKALEYQKSTYHASVNVRLAQETARNPLVEHILEPTSAPSALLTVMMKTDLAMKDAGDGFNKVMARYSSSLYEEAVTCLSSSIKSKDDYVFKAIEVTADSDGAVLDEKRSDTLVCGFYRHTESRSI